MTESEWTYPLDLVREIFLARVNAEEIATRRDQSHNVPVTIYLDNDVLEELRNRADAEGTNYQTMINQILRLLLTMNLLDEATVRKVV